MAPEVKPRYKRYKFSAPVEISYHLEDKWFTTTGTTTDVSLHGLGLEIAMHIPVDTDVLVRVAGVHLLGDANVRYSLLAHAGFKTGIELKYTVFLQDIAGLTDVMLQWVNDDAPIEPAPQVTVRPDILAVRFATSNLRFLKKTA